MPRASAKRRSRSPRWPERPGGEAATSGKHFRSVPVRVPSKPRGEEFPGPGDGLGVRERHVEDETVEAGGDQLVDATDDVVGLSDEEALLEVVTREPGQERS